MDHVLTTLPVALVAGAILCACLCMMVIVLTGGTVDVRKDRLFMNVPGVEKLVRLGLVMSRLRRRNRGSNRSSEGPKPPRLP